MAVVKSSVKGENNPHTAGYKILRAAAEDSVIKGMRESMSRLLIREARAACKLAIKVLSY